MYVYIQSEPGLWTVGHYAPDDKWIAESDHESISDAAARVAELNGGGRDEASAPGTPALRDYFAGQAAVGMLAAQSDPEVDSLPDPPDVARYAYRVADAMLKARGK